MNELLSIGINPNDIDFSKKANDKLIGEYQKQIRSAALAAWGDYWSTLFREEIDESDLYPYIATITADATTVLEMRTLPKLGLVNGLFVLEHPKFLGFCWEENNQTWVGLSPFWFTDISDEVAPLGKLSPENRQKLSLVIAEEACHARIREINPKVAEESIMANESGDPFAYWNNPGELAAKEFARLFTNQRNTNELFRAITNQ